MFHFLHQFFILWILLSVFFINVNIKVKIHWLSGKGIQNHKKLRLQLGEPCIFIIACNLSQELLTQNDSHVELRVSGKCSQWSRYIHRIISLLETQRNWFVLCTLKNKWQNYWNQSWSLLVLTSEQGKGTALKIKKAVGLVFLHLEELLGRTVFVVFAGTELNYDGGYCCLQCSPLMSSCVVCCIINDVTALKPGRLLSVTWNSATC